MYWVLYFCYCMTVSIILKCCGRLKSLSESPTLPCSPFPSVFLCPVSLAFHSFLGKSSGLWLCDTCASFGSSYLPLVNSFPVSSLLNISFSGKPVCPAPHSIPRSGLESMDLFLRTLIEHKRICLFLSSN